MAYDGSSICRARTEQQLQNTCKDNKVRLAHSHHKVVSDSLCREAASMVRASLAYGAHVGHSQLKDRGRPSRSSILSPIGLIVAVWTKGTHRATELHRVKL